MWEGRERGGGEREKKRQMFKSSGKKVNKWLKTAVKMEVNTWWQTENRVSWLGHYALSPANKQYCTAPAYRDHLQWAHKRCN
jgi:hypothetical protein